MCGRYTAAKDFGELIKLMGVVMARVPFFAPRYNIAPTQMAPVIYHELHQPAVKLMRWGLIPYWAKDESTGNALINARSETIESRTAFRKAFKQRRCLIPADSFYEWQERAGKRQPFRVMLKSGEPFCFAGLWDRWVKPPADGKFDTDLDEAPASETIDSFTIITRAANAAIAPLHDRMPVIMAPNHFGWWLKDNDEVQRIGTLSAKKDALRLEWVEHFPKGSSTYFRMLDPRIISVLDPAPADSGADFDCMEVLIVRRPQN
ncbi:MAG: SOS response-associated peptidase [Verrucomicrobiia bacterium]